MSLLFTPLKLREIEFRNRIFVSPMCQYSAENGVPNAWHLVHLGSRAVGSAGLVIAEATGVSPEGRISPGDAGLWNSEQAAAWKPIVEFVRKHGAVPGIQLAHAGRKASTPAPWQKTLPESEKWTPIAPSAVPFSDRSLVPREMTLEEIAKIPKAFAESARLALEVGFQVVELHFAHGYLLNEFLSPLSNHRKDQYGGSLENRMRLALEVTRAVREVWPQHLPLFVRVSATDWVSGGWDLAQTVELAKQLKELGVDLLDCSTGGSVPKAEIPVGPGYQVQFAHEVRRQTGLKTGAVGMITEAEQAEAILKEGRADAILMAREFLRDPYWPLHAAKKLGVDVTWPVQYMFAR